MHKSITAILIFLSSISCFAKEGMWIPSVLSAVYDDMKAAGLQLSEEDLYSVNHSSLKDAIVLFGGGCTGEIVSDQGLLFTNHHCGFDYIQYHSSLQHDYLKDGFWAMNRNEELICEGLSVSFVVRMDEVTASVREGIRQGMGMEEMEKIIAANRKKVEADYKKNYPGLTLTLRAFNYGNQFFAILMKTYTDVRLVGAPPSEIGKFGGDTDNWVWPRHTGDFSVFRIYAGKDNEPAAYSKDNQPFKPSHFLPVNIGGVKEDDYSMVYGFPGRTDHLLTSYAVDFVMNESNPMRIDMRNRSLAVIDEAMRSSDALRIKYAAKQSDIANAWKKWKGQQIGLTNFRAIDQKKKFEEDYQKQTVKKEFAAYSRVLPELKEIYTKANPVILESQAFVEYYYYGPELFGFAHRFEELVMNYDTLVAKKKLDEAVKELMNGARLFYKDFDLATEKKIFAELEPVYAARFDKFAGNKKIHGAALAEMVYNKSVFRDSTVLFKLLAKPGKGAIKKLRADYFFLTSQTAFNYYNNDLRGKVSGYNKQIDYYMQQYTEGMMLMFPGDYWSDANSTLRITFGKVDGSEPRDGEIYKWYTTADGILEKYYTGQADFEILPKLKSKLEKREYGKYGRNGELIVCYTGSNHTTGGNSGSPALNARGELTGINFDRSWESTMSDIMYNPDICRNIMVDIGYVLWVIDEYAGAGYLVEEMKVVR